MITAADLFELLCRRLLQVFSGEVFSSRLFSRSSRLSLRRRAREACLAGKQEHRQRQERERKRERQEHLSLWQVSPRTNLSLSLSRTRERLLLDQ